jgi:hypothetical protein
VIRKAHARIAPTDFVVPPPARPAIIVFLLSIRARRRADEPNARLTGGAAD